MFSLLYTITDSPDQSLDGKSDNSGEQEEGGDQDVEQRQSCEGLRRTGTGFIEEVMHHKRLRDKILNLTIPSGTLAHTGELYYG